MGENSLSHTRWKCQYHIVFIPKYRRKEIYGNLKKDIGEIIEAHACSDHIHILVSIPLKLSVSDFMGYLKGQSFLMIFERHTN